MVISCLDFFVGEENCRLVNTCVFGLADFLVGTRWYHPWPGVGWWHFYPDTVTCPKNNAARGRGFEPASCPFGHFVPQNNKYILLISTKMNTWIDIPTYGVKFQRLSNFKI